MKQYTNQKEFDFMRIREIIDWDTKEEVEFADNLEAALKPLINKHVLLSGGGSWDRNVCVLKEATLVNFPDRSKCVDVRLTDIEPPLFGKHEFEVRLWSWHISELIEDMQNHPHPDESAPRRC